MEPLLWRFAVRMEKIKKQFSRHAQIYYVTNSFAAMVLLRFAMSLINRFAMQCFSVAGELLLTASCLMLSSEVYAASSAVVVRSPDDRNVILLEPDSETGELQLSVTHNKHDVITVSSIAPVLQKSGPLAPGSHIADVQAGK